MAAQEVDTGRSTPAWLTAVRALLGFGLLMYLGLSGAIQWPALLGLAEAWPASLAALALLLVLAVLTSWRLCVLTKPRRLFLSLGSSFRLTLIGAFFNAFLPGTTGGDLVKMYYAVQSNPGRRTEIGTILVLDRLAGLLALILWPVMAAPLFPGVVESTTVRAVLWAAAGAGVAMLAALAIASADPLAAAFRKLPLGYYFHRFFETIAWYRQNPGTLLAAFAISLLAQTALVGAMLLIVETTNPAGAAQPMILLIPLGFLANALPFTPGGLGVGEVAFDRLFRLAGFSRGAEALLGWRVLTTLIDVFGLVFYLQGRRAYLRTSQDDRYGAIIEAGRRNGS